MYIYIICSYNTYVYMAYVMCVFVCMYLYNGYNESANKFLLPIILL